MKAFMAYAFILKLSVYNDHIYQTLFDGFQLEKEYLIILKRQKTRHELSSKEKICD